MRFVLSYVAFRSTLFLFSQIQTHCNFSSATFPTRVSLYLRRASLIDSIRLALRSNSPHSLPQLLAHPSLLDSFVITHALRSAPSPDSALFLFQSLKSLPNFSPTQSILHSIAKILAKSRQHDELRSLIAAINAGEFTNVTRVTYMDLLRWYALAGDLQSALGVWNEYRLALPAGGKKHRHPCTESYNLLMELYAKKGENLEAVEMFSRMINEGANPNSRTYTVVIDHLVRSGKLDAALKVFDMLPCLRIKRTLNQYSVLTEALISKKQFDLVKLLLEEMQADGILPGSSMRMSLCCIHNAGFVKETEGILEDFSSDGRIGSIQFSADFSDEEDDACVDKDQVKVNGDDIKLKPWLDPSALAVALSDWNPEEVRTLEDAKFTWTTRLVCKTLRNFKHAETAWKFFCWVAHQPGQFTHDIYTVSRMITILARHGHVELVDQLVSKVKREGIQLSFSTLRLIIDFYGISKKADAALRIFRDTEVFYGSLSKTNLMLLYSSLLRTLIKCKRGLDAMDLLDEMMVSEIYPDIQTFIGLMQHFAFEGDLRMVQKLLGIVRQSGKKPDAYMFQILIRAYCENERAALAMRVFEDMRNSGLVPDAATKALLVKSLWREGKLREAAAVEERCEEINSILPLALPGHVWTVSSDDLTRVYNVYCNSFATNCF